MVARLTIEQIAPAQAFRAELHVPGDKSISHRALMLGAIASGTSRIRGLAAGEDVAATVACLQRLGTHIDGPNGLQVEGRPLEEWASPDDSLDCRNSGTTMRLLSGLLAASRVTATLVGDASLSARPMERVAIPLRRMNALIETRDGHPPLRIEGRLLRGIEHHVMPPSAQVKSAVLLAGLHAQGETAVWEGVPTRDHTERLLAAMGAQVDRRAGQVTIHRLRGRLQPIELSVPGDLSSAAFLLAAASLRPGWSATIEGVGLNPTRTAFLDLLREMGTHVSVYRAAPDGIEPSGTVRAVGAALRPVSVGAHGVAQAIDEIPILLVLASQAHGETVVDGIGELRVKESDRIRAMAEGLRAMGARVKEHPDRIIVDGPAALRGAEVDAGGDHRIAMALGVAALVASTSTTIHGADRADVSYPGFFAALREAAGVAS